MIRTAAAPLFVLEFLLAAGAHAQPTAKTAPAPVPRAVFIQTMDAEFGKMDADKNKTLTRAEIEQSQRALALAEARSRARSQFANLDADKNGQLSLAEFEKTAVAPPQPDPSPILRQADLNRDNMITLVEYRTAKLANFDRMDADKDGVVTVPEMKAAGLVK